MKNKTLILLAMAASWAAWPARAIDSYTRVFKTVADLVQNGGPISLHDSAIVLGWDQPGDGGGAIYTATNTVTGTNLLTRIYSGTTNWSWERLKIANAAAAGTIPFMTSSNTLAGAPITWDGTNITALSNLVASVQLSGGDAQTQINSKAATNHVHAATDIGSGTVSNTEFGYLDGTTNGIQSQINGKSATNHTHAATEIGSGTVSNTEFGYLDGVSSAIQPQLDAKPTLLPDLNSSFAIAGYTFLGPSGFLGIETFLNNYNDATNLTGRVTIGNGTSKGAARNVAAAATDDWIFGGTNRARMDASGLSVSNVFLPAGSVQAQLDGKAATNHTHAATEIGSGTVSNTEFGYLDGVSSAIQPQLDAKPTLLPDLNSSFAIAGYTFLGPSGFLGIETFLNNYNDATNLTGRVTIGNGTSKGAARNVAAAATDDWIFGGTNRARMNASGLSVSNLFLPAGSVQAQLDAKAATNHTHAATEIGSGTVSNTEFGYLDGATNNIQAQINALVTAPGATNKQDLDADLTALAGTASTGLYAVTGIGSSQTRTITGTANQISVSNGDGVAGNPTVSLASGIDPAKLADGSVSAAEYQYLNGVSSAIQTQLNGKQALDSDVTALAGTASTGIYAVTGSGSSQTRTITGTASQITVSNGDGVSGNPTVSLASGIDPAKLADGTVSAAEYQYLNGVSSAIQTQFSGKQTSDADLSALAGMSATGVYARTGDGTSAARTITGTASQITVSNGDGVSGNPTLSLSSGIDPAKLADGTISATEYQYLNGLTSGIQSQLNLKANSVHTHGAADIGSGVVSDTEYSYLNGVTSAIQTQLDGKENTDSAFDIFKPDLIAIADVSSNGFWVRPGAGQAATRVIAGTANQITVTNGDGVSGNPTLSLASGIDPAKLADGTISATEYQYLNGLTGGIQTQLNTKANEVHTHSATQVASGSVSDTEYGYLDGVTSGIQAQLDGKEDVDAGFDLYKPDLIAIADVSSNGFWVRPGAGEAATRIIVGTSPISVANGNGVSGNPTISISGSIPLANLPVAASGVSDSTKLVRSDDARLAGAGGSTDELTESGTATTTNGITAQTIDFDLTSVTAATFEVTVVGFYNSGTTYQSTGLKTRGTYVWNGSSFSGLVNGEMGDSFTNGSLTPTGITVAGISGSRGLRVTITGEAGKTISWKASVRYTAI